MSLWLKGTWCSGTTGNITKSNMSKARHALLPRFMFCLEKQEVNWCPKAQGNPFCLGVVSDSTCISVEAEAASTQHASTTESPCPPGHVSPCQVGMTPHSNLPPVTGLLRNSATCNVKIKPHTLGGK